MSQNSESTKKYTPKHPPITKSITTLSHPKDKNNYVTKECLKGELGIRKIINSNFSLIKTNKLIINIYQ